MASNPYVSLPPLLWLPLRGSMGHRQREIKARSGRWRVHKRWGRDAFEFFYPTRECYHSSKASRGEDLQVKHPVGCGQSPTFHFHPTLTCIQGSTLVGNQGVEMRQTGEKCFLTPTGMMEALHHEELAVDDVMGL